MTLQNLLAIKRLQAHAADGAAIRRLLEAAPRNLADSAVTQVSADNRFDAAYKCIMQCAMLGLWANGYRTATSRPGHHQTAIQCPGLSDLRQEYHLEAEICGYLAAYAGSPGHDEHPVAGIGTSA